MPLGKNADAGDYVTDFQKSKAPQFKGKSKEKRRKMAIAAYLDAKDKKESKMKSFDDLRSNVQEAVYTSAYGKKIPVANPKMMSDFKKAEKLLMPSKNYDQGIEFVMKGMKISKPEAKKMVDKLFGVNPKTGKLEAVKGFKTDANRKAAFAKMNDDASSDAVKAFLAKGGKIKKLPPGKAQGYHGKDDPGKDMRGMLDKPDSKAFGTRKKVRSLGASTEATNYKVQVTGPDHAGVHKVKAKSQDHAHQLVMKKIGQSKLPKHMQPKTRIMGESMQKVAAVQGQMSKINDRLRKNPKHPGAGKDKTDLLDLQRKMVALRKSRNEEVKYPHMMYDPKTGNEVTAKTPADHNKYAKMGYTHEKPKSEALDAKDKPFVSNLVKKLRKGSNTHAKQADDLEKAMKKESVEEEMNFAVSIEGLPTMFMSADSPGTLKQTLRKIVKQPSLIKAVKRVTDASVKKTFRLKAQGREDDEE